MGIIRLLLALSVVIHHMIPAAPMVLVGGASAVRLFFVISGFYMALILNKKYTGPGSSWLFYSNRFLRLFPAYYLVLILPFAVSALVSLARSSGYLHGQLPVFAATWDKIGAFGQVFLTLIHVTVIGQEWMWATTWNGSTSQFEFFAPYFGEHRTAGFYLLVNPPAWTISVELCFYLLAPYLVRRPAKIQTSILAAGILLAWILPFLDLSHGFWKSQFVPTQLPYFLAGSLAYAGYARLLQDQRKKILRVAGKAGWLSFMVFLAAFPWLPESLREPAGVVLLASVLPGVFFTWGSNRFDRFAGELSYPVYLVHWNIQPFAIVASRLFWSDGNAPAAGLAIVAMVLSVASALLLYTLVDRPIDQVRQRRAIQQIPSGA